MLCSISESAVHMCTCNVQEECIMAKKHEIELVDSLTATVKFGVSSTKQSVPATEGFVIKVRFSSENDKMIAALKTVVIKVQAELRSHYEKYHVFPFQPGTMITVDGDGSFDKPKAPPTLSEIIAALKYADKDSLADIQRMITEAQMVQSTLAEASEDEGDESPEEEYLYSEEWLARKTRVQLKPLAKKHGLEDYEDMSVEELREELSLVTKE